MSQKRSQRNTGNGVRPWNPWTSQAFTNLDPFGIVSSCLAVQGAWLRRPDRLAQEAAKFWSQITLLQIQSFERFHGQAVEDTIPPVPQDERFQGSMWTESPYFDAVKEHYLAVTRWIEDAIENTPEMPDKTRRKAGFWTRQVLNALAPSNFFWTNPEALYKCLTTGGLSVLCGAQQFKSDLSRADVRMVDPAPFQVGRNLACTPGKVGYRNALLEVLQYAPTTERVHAVPIVIVAPWIYKYYILDLDAKKSLVRFLVSRGFTVFMTSWKNPGPEARDTELDDYMLEGVLRAVEVAREVAGADQVHAAGYCVGGTILTALMAWLNRAGNGATPPIGHFTLFAALADFAAPGDIEFFIDRDSLGFLEGLMDQSGYLDGAAMARSFRMLRSNGLIWHYVVRGPAALRCAVLERRFDTPAPRACTRPICASVMSRTPSSSPTRSRSAGAASICAASANPCTWSGPSRTISHPGRRPSSSAGWSRGRSAMCSRPPGTSWASSVPRWIRPSAVAGSGMPRAW